MRLLFFLFIIIATSCVSQPTNIDLATETNADDLYTIANMYSSGFGAPKDIDTAFKLYEKAARLGNVDAQLAVGDFYYDGTEVQRSYSKAKYWYEKSARGGNAISQSNLGYMYLNGEGVSVDNKTARFWFELAVKKVILRQNIFWG